MREKRSFGQRTQLSQVDRTLKKYFLVFEGAVTEKLYFQAVNEMKMEIGISPLIELVPIVRSFSEEGWSNPKKILDRLIKDIDESKTGSISYETLLNRIMDYLKEENIPTSRNVWDMLVDICEHRLGKELWDWVVDVEEECDEMMQDLMEELNPKNIISDVSDVINSGGITYADGFDKICLIVDRDRDSFVARPYNDQYTYVLNKCKKMGFGFYVTNPCFEFWLLLHYDDVFKLDQESLLLNPKISSKRRFAETELKKLCPSYHKSRYPAKSFVKNIHKAIENEKRFCEDIDQLEHTLGSNLGLLIQEMKGLK